MVTENVLLDSVVVSLVRAKPYHQVIVFQRIAKVNVHTRTHRDDVDWKLVAENVLKECVIVTLVGLETH